MSEPLTHYASNTDGLVADVSPRIVCGTPHWQIVSQYPRQVTCPDCREALRRADGMEEIAGAIRQGRWDSPCGCSWTLPGAADPAWVPCEAHLDRLWRMVHEDGEAP